jgi:hypothetical protein
MIGGGGQTVCVVIDVQLQNTGCAAKIDSYLTALRQTSQFIETSGTLNHLYQRIFSANLLFLPRHPKKKHFDFPISMNI